MLIATSRSPRQTIRTRVLFITLRSRDCVLACARVPILEKYFKKRQQLEAQGFPTLTLLFLHSSQPLRDFL